MRGGGGFESSAKYIAKQSEISFNFCIFSNVLLILFPFSNFQLRTMQMPVVGKIQTSHFFALAGAISVGTLFSQEVWDADSDLP